MTYYNRRQPTKLNLCSKPDKSEKDECGLFTEEWMIDASDELAVHNGCWFDPVLGGYGVWWIEKYCNLYEDRWAGQPAVLWGCKTCEYKVKEGIAEPYWEIPSKFSPTQATRRAYQYSCCMKQGHELDWSYQWFMRLFGWMRWDESFGCSIRRFRRADVFVPKKNAKTPRLAFLGFYLTCGDGVAGNHVYHAAVDGQQAKELAGQHAEAAHRQSQSLSQACTLNKSTQKFTYHWNNSTFLPLTTSTDKSQKAKEGLNGSVLLDETHVISPDTIKRIKRAGISRMEPLIAGMSTSGLDVISYGKERQDYGRDVAAGGIEDDGYLCETYEAPQQTDLESLDEEAIVKLGRAANPSWGITIQEREFREDYRDSSNAGLQGLADFGTYRLNIWQTSTSPGISKMHWNACKWRFNLWGLEDRYCSLGVDMSRTRDMTALAFVFGIQRVIIAEDGHPLTEDEGRDVHSRVADDICPPGYLMRVGRPVWPMFWCPRNTIDRRSRLAPFKEWVRDGQLIPTEGDTISHQQVFDELCEVASHLTVNEIHADLQMSDWLTEQLSAEFGSERFEFTQSMSSYSGPLDAFEAEILDHEFIHPDIGPLNWQAGHVHWRKDTKTRYRMPSKPTNEAGIVGKNEPRTIDGISATIMGYRPYSGADMQSIYRNPGQLAL